MRITLRQLQIFVAVAQTGSTVAAASRINLTQSASSAALRELESTLHVHLFDRIGKRLVLNDNGRQLLPRARQVLDAAAGIEQDFQSVTEPGAGAVNLGCSTTIGIYLLPHLLAAYRNEHPAGAANLGRISVANTDEVIRAVAEYEVDAGFIEGYCQHPGVRTELWHQDELVVVCAPGHPILQGRPDHKVELGALRRARWLLRETGSGTREAVEHALLPRLHSLEPAAEFSNSESIKNAAVAGLGLACLSQLVVQDQLDLGKLIQLQTTLPPLPRQLYLITAKAKLMSGRLEALLSFSKLWASRRQKPF